MIRALAARTASVLVSFDVEVFDVLDVFDVLPSVALEPGIAGSNGAGLVEP